MKKHGIIWGIACAVAALLIILTQVGLLSFEFLGGISLARTIWGIILLIVAISALCDRWFFGAVGALTAEFCIFREEVFGKLLGLKVPSVGVIIVVGVLIYLAIHFLWPNSRKRHHYNSFSGCTQNCVEGDAAVNSDNVTVEEMDGEHLYIRSRFNGTVKYINSKNLQSVEVDSEFGGTELYFNNAEVPSGVVTLDLHSRFGGVKIYIPSNWEVEEHLNNQFGSIEYKGSTQFPTEVKMILNADISFSGMEIVRV